MKANEIVNLLESEVNTWTASKTIMVSGSWGVGKSYYLKEFMKNVKNYNKNILTIYVSLFGKKSASQLNEELYQHFSSNLSSFKKIAKKILNALSDTIPTMFKGISLPDLSQIITDDSFINKTYKNKKFILIFDDLERLDYSLYREMLGYIENLSDNKNIFTIITANEEKIVEIDHTFLYRNYKEKMVFKTFTITKPADQAIISILSDYQKYFHQSIDTTNIRTIKKAIEKFKHIHEICDELKDELKLAIYNQIYPFMLYLYIDREERISQAIDEDFSELIKENLYQYTTAKKIEGIFYSSDLLYQDLQKYLETENKDFLIHILNKLAKEMNYQFKYKNLLCLNDLSKKIQINQQLEEIYARNFDFDASLLISLDIVKYNKELQLNISFDQEKILEILKILYKEKYNNLPFIKENYFITNRFSKEFLEEVSSAINLMIIGNSFDYLLINYRVKKFAELKTILHDLSQNVLLNKFYTQVENYFLANQFYFDYECRMDISLEHWEYYEALIDFIFCYNRKNLFPKFISHCNHILLNENADNTDKYRIYLLMDKYAKMTNEAKAS